MRLFQKFQRKRILHRLTKAGPYECYEIPPVTGDNHNTFVYTIKGEEPESIMEQLEMMGENLVVGFEPDESILIKINANSSLPYPASTSGRFLDSFVKLLQSKGFNRLTIGDCSSNRFLPTRSVFKRLGLNHIAKGKAELIAFEEGPYVKAELGGGYLESPRLSKYAFSFDRIINLTNMKTHCLADYSLSMKNLVGFLHPLDRTELHRCHLKEKIAELSLAIVPDLNIIDARSFFITGGPDKGEVARGNCVFVGNDMLKTDLEAYGQLYRWKSQAGVIGEFREDPACTGQICHYLRLHKRPDDRSEDCK